MPITNGYLAGHRPFAAGHMNGSLGPKLLRLRFTLPHHRGSCSIAVPMSSAASSNASSTRARPAVKPRRIGPQRRAYDQTSVRPCEDALPRPSQEPRPTFHAVRTQQPVPDAKEADGMRASLFENRQTASPAGLKRQNSLPERAVRPDQTIKPPSRRSRTR
jgi:hypothetical protein